MIPKIVFEHRNVVHEDERRSLLTMFNGDFEAEQIKIIRVKKDSVLGNHYHKYRETFFVLEGEATYTLLDTNRGNEVIVYFLKSGDRLTIAAGIAHKANIKAGTIMIEGTEEVYENAQHNDVKYEL